MLSAARSTEKPEARGRARGVAPWSAGGRGSLWRRWPCRCRQLPCVQARRAVQGRARTSPEKYGTVGSKCMAQAQGQEEEEVVAGKEAASRQVRRRHTWLAGRARAAGGQVAGAAQAGQDPTPLARTQAAPQAGPGRARRRRRQAAGWAPLGRGRAGGEGSRSWLAGGWWDTLGQGGRLDSTRLARSRTLPPALHRPHARARRSWT